MRPIDMSEWDTYMSRMLVGRKVWDDYDRGYTDALDQMDDWLDAQPAITLDDLRPKGRWVSNGIPDSMLSKCTACGFPCGAYSFHFCPSCGADMRGGGEDA